MRRERTHNSLEGRGKREKKKKKSGNVSDRSSLFRFRHGGGLGGGVEERRGLEGIFNDEEYTFFQFAHFGSLSFSFFFPGFVPPNYICFHLFTDFTHTVFLMTIS